MGVLLLVVLYSPIGSPDLYIQQNQNIYRPVVNFSTAIANAPKGTTVQDYEEAGTGAPDYSNVSKTYTFNSQAGISKPISPTHYVVPTKTDNHSESTQSSSGVSGFSYSGSGSMVRQQNNSPQTDGISTFFANLFGFDDPAVPRQLSPSGVLEGIADPGEDPEGGLIPVGDGFQMLLLFSVGYAFRIRISKFHELVRI